MTPEQIAQVCHDANRAYALTTGEDPKKVWPVWDSPELPQNIRDSAIVGVRMALAGSSPEQLHESWMVSKIVDGWSYGTVRDNAAKIHNCLIEYAQLPAAQRVKDSLFYHIVVALGTGQE